MSRFDRTPGKTKRAQSLRNDMPVAERKLWSKLKNRQIAGFRFRRQHPVGPYFLDFYCPELKLCIELDGDQHAEEAALEKDRKRTKFLERKGICVVRYWNGDVFESRESVTQSIYHRATELKREAEILRDITPSP